MSSSLCTGNNALKLRPSFLKARVVRARALLSMGKTEEAIRDLSYAKKGKTRFNGCCACCLAPVDQH